MMRAHKEQARAATLRMGIDVGGTAMKWVVLRGEQVVRSGTRPTPRDSAEAVLAAVAGLAAQEAELATVGIALPAVVDFERGATLVVPNLPGDWVGRPVAGPLSAALGVPVALANDARALTLAEWRSARRAATRTPSCSRSAPASGGGIVSGGRVVRGPRGRAGEIGHMPSSRRRALRLRRDRLPGDGRGRPRARPRRGGGRAARPGPAARGRERRHAARPSRTRRGAATPAPWPSSTAPARASAAPSRRSPSPSTPRSSSSAAGWRPPSTCCAPRSTRSLASARSLYGTIPVVPATLGLHAGAIGAALWKDAA